MPSLPRPTLYRLLAGVAGLVLVASGCGSGGGSKGSVTIPVNTTAPPPGRVQLGMIVVQPSDLPGGWASKKVAAAANPAAERTALAKCVGTPDTATLVVAVANSPDYVKGSDVITSTATSFKTRGAVPSDTEALINAKGGACLEQVDKARLAAVLPKGGTVGSYVVKVTPGTGGGAGNITAIATSTITFTLNHHSLTLNDETVFLVAPRIETRIDFYSATEAIPAAVKTAVVNHVSARVAFGS